MKKRTREVIESASQAVAKARELACRAMEARLHSQQTMAVSKELLKHNESIRQDLLRDAPALPSKRLSERLSTAS